MTFYPAYGILKTVNAKGKSAVISIDRFEEILGELAEELREALHPRTSIDEKIAFLEEIAAQNEGRL